MPLPQATPRLLPILMAAALAFPLTACAASTPSARAPIDLPSLPSSMTRCDRPVALPVAALGRGDVERLWIRDRAALVRCGASLSALVAYYEDLSARLRWGAR
jgi:hypothetical protein